ncbi:MAG: hypothetical protein U0X91_09250 [Spirosomataceae bacterium]
MLLIKSIPVFTVYCFVYGTLITVRGRLSACCIHPQEIDPVSNAAHVKLLLVTVSLGHRSALQQGFYRRIG